MRPPPAAPARPPAPRPRRAPRPQAAAPRRPPTELELEDIDSFCWAWAEVEPHCVGTIAGKEEVAKVIEATRCPPPAHPAARSAGGLPAYTPWQALGKPFVNQT